MATKKKAAAKKKAPSKKVAKKKIGALSARPVVTIFILPDANATPFPATVFADGNGIKQPPKVAWQAVDITRTYMITLDNPPAPFKKGNEGPFLTDSNGLAGPFQVDKTLPNGTRCTYTVDDAANPTAKSAHKKKSGGHTVGIFAAGGGIIIDS